jgi:malate dehydrogenase (oxaloacetate-decarboxylating)
MTLQLPASNAADDLWAYVKNSAEACKAVAADPDQAFQLTARWNTVAVISDGSAVPGLGAAGPLAALPLVEEKCRALRRLAGLEARPLVLDVKSLDEAVRTVASLAQSFGAVNLEAFVETEAMELKRRLTDLGDLPVCQDALDALPVVCLAALTNALKAVRKKITDVRLVISGAETEGLALVDFLRLAGLGDVVVCDRSGAICRGRPGPTNWVMEELAQKTNPRQIRGSLAKALAGADALLLLAGGAPLQTKSPATLMAPNSIILSLVDQPDSFFFGATVSAAPNGPLNQLDACLALPGLLRGALDARALAFNAPMKMAAALALSKMVPEAELGAELIVPNAAKPGLVTAMAEAVSAAAAASGVSRLF